METTAAKYQITLVTCTNAETLGIDDEGSRCSEREIANLAACAADEAFAGVIPEAMVRGESDFKYWNGGYGGRQHRFRERGMFVEVARIQTDEDGDEKSEWLADSDVQPDLAARVDAALAAASDAHYKTIQKLAPESR